MSTVLFAHVPFFYAAVERARDPALRDRPVIVGGDPRKRGNVQSASPEAVALGVRESMPMLAALEHCPRARVLKTDMRYYRELSGRLRAQVRSKVEELEPVALDACYVDASRISDPEVLARGLIARVRELFDLPLSVGIAPVKFLARLAAEEAGPGELKSVLPGEEQSFLQPLPVERLPGVGPNTLSALAELGVQKVGDLLELDPAAIEQALGNHGLRILERARGEDASPIRVARHPRSLSRESTLDADQLDLGILGERLGRLAKALETALRRDGLRARRVALKVRYADQETVTRSLTQSGSISTSAEIFACASQLLDRTHAGSRPIRLVGITLGGLGSAGPGDRQLDLFS